VSAFQKLSDSFVILANDRVFPRIGQYGLGAVAVVLPDEQLGRSFIAEHGEGIASLGLGVPRLGAVGDPWQFMRRAAGEGLAGIEGPNLEVFPERFMFMVRVEEAGEELPTILAAMTETGWDRCLTRLGEVELSHAAALHWQRFDVLDSVSGLYGLECPFRNWDQGEPLYELRSDSLAVLIAEVPLLGDWNSTEGAFAFFTESADAEHYRECRLGDGRNRMIGLGASTCTSAEELMASIRPQPVIDLSTRLAELVTVNPLAAWCVNPTGHRENAAYGRLEFGTDHPAQLRVGDESTPPRMIAVSGHWLVKPENRFVLERELAPWSGLDTIRWTGGQTAQLHRLDRSYAVESATGGVDLRDLTETDAEMLADALLQGGQDLEVLFERATSEPDDQLNALDMFHIIAWDAVTGDGGDIPLRFESVVDALSFLACFEQSHDQQHRVGGTVSCSHIGFTGSKDEKWESQRGERFRLGLRQIVIRILRQGYRPADADDLASLCNGTLRTLHVDLAGYPKDLLWQSPAEHISHVSDALGVDEPAFLRWSKSVNLPVDPVGEQLALKRIGEQAWSGLELRARHFLSTALVHWEQQGCAPQLDYAPISLEIVKALEVQLTSLLLQYRERLLGEVPEHDAPRYEERVVAEYLGSAEARAPAIGVYTYLLRRPKAGASGLANSFYDYVQSTPNGVFLTSKEFAKKGLNSVIHKYRNSGVHDSPIPWLTCKECIERLIGMAGNPGFIASIVAH